MAFGTEHVETTEGAHFFAFNIGFRNKRVVGSLVGLFVTFGTYFKTLRANIANGEPFSVSTEDDVNTCLLYTSRCV